MPQGTLFLVVGPSGAGKDTLIEEACRRRPDLHHVRRMITRPAVDESHVAISVEEFSQIKRNYGFALSWDAHGFRYGVPSAIHDSLASGQSVILNGSRSIVDEARATFNSLRVVYVTAPLDLLSRRLRGRGREDADGIENRLGRVDRGAPRGIDVITIDNSGDLEHGVEQFLAALV